MEMMMKRYVLSEWMTIVDVWSVYRSPLHLTFFLSWLS